eukprot:TRINITY_DN38962_c0_g1_i1.p1 TRINITY_DN38962_c0_g1~~TRINITY_DN38962_c0_g1_i1.p1  ORF type:complete len:168 (+),score=17.18 TRINITY_DN38962_c0_g1_i1:76-504(+)
MAWAEKRPGGLRKDLQEMSANAIRAMPSCIQCAKCETSISALSYDFALAEHRKKGRGVATFAVYKSVDRADYLLCWECVYPMISGTDDLVIHPMDEFTAPPPAKVVKRSTPEEEADEMANFFDKQNAAEDGSSGGGGGCIIL